jgi:hypothetical protein
VVQEVGISEHAANIPLSRSYAIGKPNEALVTAGYLPLPNEWSNSSQDVMFFNSFLLGHILIKSTV